ncbi:uncharacterized protein C1orf159-like [Acridotheres tristis]
MLRGALRDGNPGRAEHIWRLQLLKVNFSPQISHLEDLYLDLCFPGMEVPFVLLLTRLVAEVAGKSTENSGLEQECCVGTPGSNGSSCPGTQSCNSGCFRSEDGSSSCERCRNSSDCRDGSRGMNLSTAMPFLQDTGSVAVALLVAPFVLSLFLILSVAAFFCLRRARSLPGLCYNNKGHKIIN